MADGPLATDRPHTFKFFGGYVLKSKVGNTTFSPTFLWDGVFGYTRFDQWVDGPQQNKNVGLDDWGIPGTNGDALRALQNLPGVARGPATSGQLPVRGLPSNSTLVYVDGTWVPLVFHLGGLSATTAHVLTVLSASGKDVLLVETVGVGQDELVQPGRTGHLHR